MALRQAHPPTGSLDPDVIRENNRAIIKGLKVWTDDSVALLKEASDAGLRLKRKGHIVTVYNRHGGTVSVSQARSLGIHTIPRQRNDIAKLIAEDQLHERTDADQDSRHAANIPTRVDARSHTPGDNAPGDNAPGDNAVKTQTVTYTCEICPTTKFPNQNELDRHRAKVGHVQCPEPGCGQWLRQAKSKGAHVNIHHRGMKPWEASANATRGRPRGNPRARQPAVIKANDTPRHVDTLDGPVEVLKTDNGQPMYPLDEVLAEAEAEDLHKVPSGNGLSRPGRTGTPKIGNDTDRIELIRAILGEDPQIVLLKGERDAWRYRAEEAEAKVQIMREALQRANEAAAL